MTVDTAVAMGFFEACETGQGWAGCKEFCADNASFASQAEPLAEMQTLQEYTEWMKSLFTLMPDASYELKSFAVDGDRGNVAAYGIFSGTHTGEGGPVPPTGKTTHSDYVYVMEFADGRISHVTKIWHAGWALRELGWA